MKDFFSNLHTASGRENKRVIESDAVTNYEIICICLSAERMLLPFFHPVNTIYARIYLSRARN